MPNFSVKYTILDKNLEEMTPLLMSLLTWQIPQQQKIVTEQRLRAFLKDWQAKHTSLYDTGEI